MRQSSVQQRRLGDDSVCPVKQHREVWSERGRHREKDSGERSRKTCLMFAQRRCEAAWQTPGRVGSRLELLHELELQDRGSLWCSV